MPHSVLSVAIYLRISSDPLGLLAGVDRQRTDCTAIAAARYPEHPVQVYQDNDKSAWSGARRPAFEAMLDALRAGTLHAVIAWDQDRLIRLPRELEPLITMCEKQQFTRMLTAQGDLDLTTEDGAFKARIMAAVAKKESDAKSRRLRRALLDGAERGKWHGGLPPYGFVLDAGQLTVVEDEADHIRQVAEDILQGRVSLRTVARASASGDGGRSPRTQYGWKNLLTSPTLIGRTRINTRGLWAPILEDDVYARLVALFSDPSRRTQRTHERQHWMSGLLRCGAQRSDPQGELVECSGRLRAQTRGRFSCPLCHGVAVSIAAVEPYVIGFVYEAALGIADPVPAVPAPADSERLTEMAVDYASGTITRGEWLAARGVLLAARPVTPVQPVVRPLPHAWRGLTPHEKHSLAAQALLGVWVQPRGPIGSVFDPTRLDPRPRPVADQPGQGSD